MRTGLPPGMPYQRQIAEQIPTRRGQTQLHKLWCRHSTLRRSLHQISAAAMAAVAEEEEAVVAVEVLVLVAVAVAEVAMVLASVAGADLAEVSVPAE